MPVATATIDPRGLKRACTNCGTRYYDMGKRPIKCPECATEYTGEIKLKARRGRAAAIEDIEAKPAPEDDAIEQIDREDNVISLEDVETPDDDSEDDIDIAPEGDLEDLEDDPDLDVKIEKE
jgi:uncharacterized protein (TIGR02300 family)